LGGRKTTKRTRKSPLELLDVAEARLDWTRPRAARPAMESRQTSTGDPDRTRRIIDPFDAIRANRVLRQTIRGSTTLAG